MTVACADDYYETAGTPSVAPCTTPGPAVYSGCAPRCTVPAARTGYVDDVACAATLEFGNSCSRKCADGYYSPSGGDTASWAIECACDTSTTKFNWAGQDPDTAAPGDCVPKWCTDYHNVMIANSNTTLMNSTLNTMHHVQCDVGYSGGGYVKCVVNGANDPVWKYKSAGQDTWDVEGYPRCSPVQCPGAGQSLTAAGATSDFTNVADVCHCAVDYVAKSGDAGSARAPVSYDDDCIGNACSTPVGATDGGDFAACNALTSGADRECAVTRTDYSCTNQMGLWCYENGTYVASTTCTELDCSTFTCAAGSSANAANAASTDRTQANCCTADATGATTAAPVASDQYTGYIPITGTYNCSTSADTVASYKAAVEGAFPAGGPLAERTWTWTWGTNQIDYATDWWTPGTTAAAVAAAFDTAFAAPAGLSYMAAENTLAACNLTAGAPVGVVATQAPGGTGATTAAPTDPGTASSAVLCLVSMMLALFAHLA